MQWPSFYEAVLEEELSYFGVGEASSLARVQAKATWAAPWPLRLRPPPRHRLPDLMCLEHRDDQVRAVYVVCCWKVEWADEIVGSSFRSSQRSVSCVD